MKTLIHLLAKIQKKMRKSKAKTHKMPSMMKTEWITWMRS
jgi:hypothetical protein